MKKSVLLILTSLISLNLYAMEALSDQDLQQIEGQSGADLSLKLTLNQNILSDAELQNGIAPTFYCGSSIEKCRLAISPNKRFMNGTTPSDSMGNRLWLVFKGIQGTLNIQKMALDGTDLIYGNTIKPAIQLGFVSSLPLQIRNYGFDSLSIEKDSFTSSQTTANALVEPTGQTGGYGYLNTGTYQQTVETVGTVASGATTGNQYDIGRERGFMGIKMNGNLALQGSIMMFSCSSDNKRC